MRQIYFSFIVLLFSCDCKTIQKDCVPLDSGTYTYNVDGESEQELELIMKSELSFEIDGISFLPIWGSEAPLTPITGFIQEDCTIIIDSYSEKERVGPKSKGGYIRDYRESISGDGEYFPESDSIVLHINYFRSSSWKHTYVGDVFLIKN